MIRGYIDHISRQQVHGWAADDSSVPDSAVDIWVFVNGRKVVQVPCDNFRRDLLASGTFGNGNHGFRVTLPESLLPDGECRVAILSSDGDLLPGGYKVLPPLRRPQDLSPIPGDRPCPVGYDSDDGHAGAFPEYLRCRGAPIRGSVVNYYWTAFRTLTARGNLESLDQIPARLVKSPHFVGSNPFSAPEFTAAFKDQSLFVEMFAGVLPDALRHTFRNIVSAYYDRLAVDQGKQDVRFFAEKRLSLSPEVRDFTAQLFGTHREIVLIRDPRDIYASRLAYFSLDVEMAMKEISNDCQDLLHIKQRQNNDTTIFIRYEEMVSDHQKVCGSCQASWGLWCPPADTTP